MADTIVFYGSTILLKSWCYKCRSDSIILDSHYQCCHREYKPKKSGYVVKREVIAEFKRRRPSHKRILEMILKQESRCVYCDRIFGEQEGKKYITPHVDHIIPFSFSQNNHHSNFVMSCNICNQRKHNKMFYSIEHAREYLKPKTTS